MNIQNFIYILFNVFLIILIADFISGLGHWFEDRYGNPKWAVLGKHIVIPNIEHHYKPRKFLATSYLYRNSTTFIAVATLIIPFYFLNFINWQSILFLIYLSQVNEVHAISHRRKIENPKFIQWFQKIGLIQSAKHHASHHHAEHDSNYCIMTEYLNPIFDKINFWIMLENGLKLFSIHRINEEEREAFVKNLNYQ